MKFYVERTTSYSGVDGLGMCVPDSWVFEDGTEAISFFNELIEYDELQHLFLDGYDSVSSIHHKNRLVCISMYTDPFDEIFYDYVQWDYEQAKEYEERNQ